MIRALIAAALALLATPAAAQTVHSVTGATPAPAYTVCAGDTLILRNPMGRELKADGSREKSWTVWIDRQNGKSFTTPGATGLRLVETVPGKGSIYAPMDAKPCASVSAPSGPLFGANLSGGEASGSDAVRPSAEDWRGYIERHGFKLIRYPFKLERMTPARIAELQANVAYAKTKGVPVILDRHDYTWRTPPVMIADWTAFARNFPDDGSVMLDLVNEPKGFNDPVLTNDWDQWLRDSNATINGLRANGIRHPILLEYPQWSATFRFDKSERITATYTKPCESAACAIDRGGGLKDPLGLTFINGHRYFDKGSSGTNKDCTATSSGFVEFADQLRRRGLKAYITESGLGSHYGMKASCQAVAKEAVAALRANSDVLLGVTWWGGGRIWPESYIFKIDPPKAVRFTAPTSTYVKMLAGDAR